MERKLISRIALGGLAIFLTAGAPSGGAMKKVHLPSLLKEVENKYARLASLRADFVQNENIANLNMKKESKGILYVQKPNKFRWETQEPNASIAVTNGEKFWYYTPPFDEDEMGMVQVTDSSQIKSEMMNALLSAQFSKFKNMRVRETEKFVFELVPKEGKAGRLLSATVTVDPYKKIIKKAFLKHRGGNTSEITLNEIQLGSKLKTDLFDFKVPPGTEVIQNGK